MALDNLVDLIVTCLTHPAAANQTFLVSDGEDLSTTQLLWRMGSALGKPARLIPVPVLALKLGAALVGKPKLAQRLCGSLQIDMSKTQEPLGILCITPAGLWYADRDGPQDVFLEPIAPLLTRKTSRRTARARVATDRREECRGSFVWRPPFSVIESLQKTAKGYSRETAV